MNQNQRPMEKLLRDLELLAAFERCAENFIVSLNEELLEAEAEAEM